MMHHISTLFAHCSDPQVTRSNPANGQLVPMLQECNRKVLKRGNRSAMERYSNEGSKASTLNSH